MLHHFETPGDKERYKARAREIIDALAGQAHKRLGAADHPEQLVAALQSEAFAEMVDELLNRWDAMRSVQGYVARSLGNLLNSARKNYKGEEKGASIMITLTPITWSRLTVLRKKS